MSKLASGSWWTSLGLGRRSNDTPTDFGDMGTAFGLDASIEAERDIGERPWRDSEPSAAAGGDRSRKKPG
jgi:hypothetical protein